MHLRKLALSMSVFFFCHLSGTSEFICKLGRDDGISSLWLEKEMKVEATSKFVAYKICIR
jgi:hypothetical protein